MDQKSATIEHKSKDSFKTYVKSLSGIVEISMKNAHRIGSFLDLTSIDRDTYFDFINKVHACSICGINVDENSSKNDIASLLLFAINNALPKDTVVSDERVAASFVGEEISHAVDVLADIIADAPYDYDVVIPLPNLQFTPNSPIPLASNVYFDCTRSTYPPILMGLPQDKQDQNCACIRIREKGLGGFSISSPVVERALRTFRHVLMLSYVLGTVKVDEYSDIKLFDDSFKKTTYCYTHGHGHTSQAITMPLIHTYALARMHLDSSIEKYFLSIQINGAVHNMIDIDRLATCLNSEGIDYERIKSSLEWLFEALFTDNTTSAFVMTSLAIEAMVGDENSRNNTSAVIGSRLAYAMHSTYSQKVQFSKSYDKFYKIRSAIVHGSKLVITAADLDLLLTMRFALLFMIRTELSALHDKKGEAAART